MHSLPFFLFAFLAKISITLKHQDGKNQIVSRIPEKTKAEKSSLPNCWSKAKFVVWSQRDKVVEESW